MRPQGTNIDPDKPCDAPMPMMMMLMLRGPARLILIHNNLPAGYLLCTSALQTYNSTVQSGMV